jgi:2-polyprenyl-3-methyl-5-hydroxy-6-metoxy-1,4-benzoquinol methylase
VAVQNPGGSNLPSSDQLGPSLANYRHLGDHWARYELASRLGGRKSILDVGCGYGFGACVLAPDCADYVGLDTDSKAIPWARNHVQPVYPNTSFLDTSSLDRESTVELAKGHYGGLGFDLVIAFEVVEHVYDPVAFVNFIFSLCNNGGVVLLSTPNGELSHGDPRLYASSYHVREFSMDEVVNLLNRQSTDVSVYGQRKMWHLSTLRRWILGPPFLSSEERTKSRASSFVQRGIGVLSGVTNRPNWWILRELRAGTASTKLYPTLVFVARHDLP